MGGRHLGCIALLVGVFTGSASGYTLLGFPSHASVQAGGYKHWQLDQASPPTLSLSYAIESTFLAGSAGARAAAENALAGWDGANTTLGLTSAGYEPVVNSDENWAAGGWLWEGPGGAAGGVGIGANIDILSRPTGFQFTFRGTNYQFDANTLAFAVPIVMSGNILSADVYLNSDFNWATDGGHFDVQTVVLHEVGHVLGLDHPDQAAAHGAANYDPYTHQPGRQWSYQDVMHSTYYPDGINRELGDDEIGGLAFLYPGVLGDANLDRAFTFADVQLAIDMFFGFTDPPNPEALHNIDFNENGGLNFSDVDRLILDYFFPDQSSSGGCEFTLSLLEQMGYNTTGLPEPQSLLLFLLLFGAGAGRRNRGNWMSMSSNKD